jgi:hypothetical protein
MSDGTNSQGLPIGAYTHSFLLDAIAGHGAIILPFSYMGATVAAGTNGSDPFFNYPAYTPCESTPNPSARRRGSPTSRRSSTRLTVYYPRFDLREVVGRAYLAVDDANGNAFRFVRTFGDSPSPLGTGGYGDVTSAETLEHQLRFPYSPSLDYSAVESACSNAWSEGLNRPEFFGGSAAWNHAASAAVFW